MRRFRKHEMWERKRDGRQVIVMSNDVGDTAGDRVTVLGERTSSILVSHFLRDYVRIQEAGVGFEEQP